MHLLNRITFGLLLISGVALYTGLNKIVSFTILLALIGLKLLFNKLSRIIDHSDLKTASLLIPCGSKNQDRSRFFLKLLVNLLATLGSLTILWQFYLMAQGQYLSAYEPLSHQIVCLGFSLGMLFYAIFAMRHIQSGEEQQHLQWYRAIGYFSVYHLLIFAMYFISTQLVGDESEMVNAFIDYGLYAGFFWLALVSAEFLVYFLRNLVLLLRGKITANLLPVPFFVSVVAAENSLKESLLKSIEAISGIDLAKSEIASFCLRIFEPVCIISAFMLWLLSSMVIVGPEQQAIFTRFGKFTETSAAGPGFYFKLPWPFAEVQVLDAYRIRTLNIGFEPDPKQRHMIWTKAHALKYFELIVGDGVEIIAIDCQVMYRIKDLYSYSKTLQNPEEFISATAYKLITQETVSARFDEIIARDRGELSMLIKTKLQAAADKMHLGVDVIEVVFLAMHPPLEIAEHFEDVISAQIDKLTFVLRANTEVLYNISMNKALAKGKELEAESYFLDETAKATGEANSLASRIIGYEYDPELARFRLRCENLQKVLTGKNLYVIDSSLMRQEDKIFLDISGQER
ncbi:MAG: hypothetical protein CVV42_06915 [Candidatus Riflebacteria bacterium HGW-Riflebacteria-2]|jgi:regulator of protease activity HflC (stomatin/prohibitin superfamily)|nr:MAG: hypothetical protein CVV42_06915 [Candidatus Riflebacteria bacterium HGW-Riflebacteria-2]